MSEGETHEGEWIRNFHPPPFADAWTGTGTGTHTCFS